MKVFIAALVLIFSLQSFTKADDISEFEIEGMSIGDSALDYLSKSEIEKNKYYAYPIKEFYQSYFFTSNSENYTSVQFSIKEGDKNFILSSIEGAIHPISFSECKKRKKIIEKDILTILPNLVVSYGEERPMWSDPESKEITTEFYFNKTFFDGGAIRIICVDRSKRIEEEKNWVDSLRVVINSKEFNIYIDKNANLNN